MRSHDRRPESGREHAGAAPVARTTAPTVAEAARRTAATGDAAPSVQRSPVEDVPRTPGRSPDDSVRADRESRLGADFSDVRVHIDAAVHELTHVIQQRSGPVAGTGRGDGTRVCDPADRFAQPACATYLLKHLLRPQATLPNAARIAEENISYHVST